MNKPYCPVGPLFWRRERPNSKPTRKGAERDQHRARSDRGTGGANALRHHRPKATLDRMARCAEALVDVVKSRRLSVTISGREHLTVEAWTTLGGMVGVYAVIAWTKRTRPRTATSRARSPDPCRPSRRCGRGGMLEARAHLAQPRRLRASLDGPDEGDPARYGLRLARSSPSPATRPRPRRRCRSLRRGRVLYRGRQHDLLPLRRVGQARPGAGRPLVLRRRRLLQLLRTLATGGIAQSTPRATARRPAQCRSSSGRLQAGSMTAPRRGGVCSRCKAEPIAERLVVRGLWVCGRCVYEFEHGPGEPVSRSRTREPQTETLFPLDEVGTGNPTVAAAGPHRPVRPPRTRTGTVCPLCAGPKTNRAVTCQPCWIDKKRAESKPHVRAAPVPTAASGSLTSAMIVVCEPVRSRARRPASRSRSLTPGASR